MKRYGGLMVALCLTACSSEENIDDYLTLIQQHPEQPVEPLPQVVAFTPLSYAAQGLRSPFTEPKPEGEATNTSQQACAIAPVKRNKEPLENYSLTSLSMHGTLGNAGKLVALIKTPDGQLLKVGKQGYMGLNQGQVVTITPTLVELRELIPDGQGCWSYRTTQLSLLTSSSAS